VVPVPSDSHTGCLVLFQQGRVDAITGDDTVLAGLAAQDPYARVVGRAFSAEPYGVGVSQDHVDLVRFVNGVLQQMRTDGRLAKSYDRWLRPALGPLTALPTPVSGRS
jgi:polar amino acid transport system substrate-binding protein